MREKKNPTTTEEVDVFVFLEQQNAMFEGIAKLNGTPKLGDNFVAGNLLITCKNSKHDNEHATKWPIIGEVSSLNNLSFEKAKEALLRAGFVQIFGDIKDALLVQCAPDLISNLMMSV